MSVEFPGYSNVNANTMRYAMGIVTNPGNGPDRYESMDIWRLRNVWGSGRGYAFSDYVGLNFFSYVEMRQGEGFVYDGCAGRDHWCYYSATDQNGSPVGPWSGPSTYNSEFGYGAGTFLTFGYGLAYTYIRPNSGHNFVSYSSGPYNCRAFYVYVYRNGGAVAYNFFAYAGGDHYTEHYFISGFQTYNYMECGLILWY
jgi:hypothetical protein